MTLSVVSLRPALPIFRASERCPGAVRPRPRRSRSDQLHPPAGPPLLERTPPHDWVTPRRSDPARQAPSPTSGCFPAPSTYQPDMHTTRVDDTDLSDYSPDRAQSAFRGIVSSVTGTHPQPTDNHHFLSDVPCPTSAHKLLLPPTTPILTQVPSVSTESTLETVFESAAPIADVIFVHGLTGDPHKTWTTSNPADFWPLWLQAEFPNLSLYTLGYPASLFAKWARSEMDLFERAANTLEVLAGRGIGTRPLVFVAHSLGGILVKILLRKAHEAGDEDWQRVSTATRLVIFLSTPHTGSSLANVLALLPRSSPHVAILADKTGFLNDLNGHYRSLTNSLPDLSTVVYYEKHTTRGVAVVSRASADPGITNVQPVPIDKSHIDICKPSDTLDTVYLGVRRHLQRLLTSLADAASNTDRRTWTDDYHEPNLADRRDLLQKLIDAGREHEYTYANDAQNRFARRYTRTGLLTPARDDHENFLSEIETRFVTHVYHPLICRSAPDRDVRAALQELVVDPLSDRVIGGTRFTAKSVMSGLFFLTEQCHIRWDRPSE